MINFDKKSNHHKKRRKKSSKKKKGKRKSHRKKKKQHLDPDDNVDLSAYESYEDESDKSSDNDKNQNRNELYEFLKEIKLEQYYVTLCEDGFDDIQCLLELNKEDLMNLGFKNGHCKKLLKSIKMFNEKNETQSIKSDRNQIEGQHFYVSPK